ncbi:MAG: hypothetical protein LBU42_05100 [Prevotellaceae bacterium]|jgi:hypothetical protein|nr:hypothetical protein [Prevotellaceae bacterium]
MNWKNKARVLNLISPLPKPLSYNLHYQMQRHFGGLKRPYNPTGAISVAIEILNRIQKTGGTPIGKTFFEVGTGWCPVVPLVYWLAGAEKIITVDLNLYLRKELIEETLLQLKKDNKFIISELCKWGGGVEERFVKLSKFFGAKIRLQDFLELCHITYYAPYDAARTNLPNTCIDYYTSNAVFEHIPFNVLEDILVEGNRIIKEDGMFVHNIDYSDHFAYGDKNISAINFLQYDDVKWYKYGKNAYVNRLRHDDFIMLFEKVNHEILEITVRKDENVQKILEEERLQISEKLKLKSNEILSITGACFITKKNK